MEICCDKVEKVLTENETCLIVWLFRAGWVVRRAQASVTRRRPDLDILRNALPHQCLLLGSAVLRKAPESSPGWPASCSLEEKFGTCDS